MTVIRGRMILKVRTTRNELAVRVTIVIVGAKSTANGVQKKKLYRTYVLSNLKETNISIRDCTYLAVTHATCQNF